MLLEDLGVVGNCQFSALIDNKGEVVWCCLPRFDSEPVCSTLLDKDNPDVYAYTRELDGKKMLVVLNFKSKPASAKTGLDVSKAKVVLGNYPSPSQTGELRPYEAVIYEW